MARWKKRKMPSRKSRRESLAPNQVRQIEPASWTGELPPLGPAFVNWLDHNTESLKKAVRSGDVESVDELLQILKTPCIQVHHPDNPPLAISVCEQVASKIRAIRPYAATDDISDMLNAAALDLEKEWIPFWQTKPSNRDSFVNFEKFCEDNSIPDSYAMPLMDLVESVENYAQRAIDLRDFHVDYAEWGESRVKYLLISVKEPRESSYLLFSDITGAKRYAEEDVVDKMRESPEMWQNRLRNHLYVRTTKLSLNDLKGYDFSELMDLVDRDKLTIDYKGAAREEVAEAGPAEFIGHSGTSLIFPSGGIAYQVS